MIGMAKACKGGATLANYVMKPEKGYELMRYGLSGDTPIGIMQQMKIVQDSNSRAKNKYLSLVLSPEKKEGQQLSNAKLRQLTKEFMEALGIDPAKQQYIAVVHTEKEHKHIHIITNRVKIDGSLISDKHIGKRAQWEAHKIAKKHGLISAKERQIENLKKLAWEEKNIKGVKKSIKKKHDWTLKQKPLSLKGYIKIMDKLGVEVIPVKNKYSEEIQGLRVKDKKSGLEFKASEVHRSMSLNKIDAAGIPYKVSEEKENTDDVRINSKEFGVKINEFLTNLARVLEGPEESQEVAEEYLKRKRWQNSKQKKGRRI